MDKLSEKNLVGIDTRLAGVVRRAAEISPERFLVMRGLSDSGSHAGGRAVDVTPLLEGNPAWTPELGKIITDALVAAAGEQGQSIVCVPAVAGAPLETGLHVELKD